MSDIIFVGACGAIAGSIVTLIAVSIWFSKNIHFEKCNCMMCKMCEGSNGK